METFQLDDLAVQWAVPVGAMLARRYALLQRQWQWRRRGDGGDGSDGSDGSGSEGAGSGARSRSGDVDVGVLLRDLVRVHGVQLLLDGCHNADPHPGNVLVVPSSLSSSFSFSSSSSSSSIFSSRNSTGAAAAPPGLGLIDYGQCKAISCEERLAIARFVLAVADERPVPELADALRNCGMRAC